MLHRLISELGDVISILKYVIGHPDSFQDAENIILSFEQDVQALSHEPVWVLIFQHTIFPKTADAIKAFKEKYHL